MGDAWNQVSSTLKKIFVRESDPRTFTTIPPGNTDHPDLGQPLTANECYVSVTLSRMQLKYSGRLWKEFYPLVHSYIELSRKGEDRITVPSVAGESLLTDTATGGQQRIIVKNVDLLPPAPYIGGNLNIAIGLFQASSNDYLKNLMGILESLSSVIGNKALSTVLDVIGPLKDGAEAMLGLSDVTPRLGIVNGFSPTSTAGDNDDESLLLDGYYALIATSEDEIDSSKLHFEDGKLYVKSGSSKVDVDADHVVIRISQVAEIKDWNRYEELDDALNLVLDASAEHELDSKEFKNQMIVFQSVVRNNKDLVDAQRLQIIKGALKQAQDYREPPEVPAKKPAAKARLRRGLALQEAVAKGPNLLEARSSARSMDFSRTLDF